MHVILQRAGIRYIGVHALLEGKLAVAAEIVALPVTRTVRALAPVFLIIGTVDLDLIRRALVEAGEITAEHEEVCAHREGQRHVVVMHDTAIGADRDIDARLFIVLIACLADIDECRGLATADALRLARDADGTATDTDLDEVGAGLGEEAEAIAIDDIACADLRLRIMLMHPLQREALPLGEAFGGIDTEHIGTGLEQLRHALRIIARVDTRAHDIALVGIRQFQIIFFIIRIVLAEHHVLEVLLLVDERQHVQFVFPNEVVGHRQRRRIGIRRHQFLKRRHELFSLRLHRHAGDTVVTTRHDADELAIGFAVLGDRHRGMARLAEQLQDLPQRRLRRDVGITADETGFVMLHAGNHRRLLLRRLRAEDKGDTTFLGESNGHGIVGHRLHDGRGHGDVHRERRLLTFLELHERRAQGNILRNALVRRIAGYQQVLAKSVRWFREIECQLNPFFLK